MKGHKRWRSGAWRLAVFAGELTPAGSLRGRNVGDRDAFLMAVGVFDQFCDEGMR